MSQSPPTLTLLWAILKMRLCRSSPVVKAAPVAEYSSRFHIPEGAPDVDVRELRDSDGRFASAIRWDGKGPTGVTIVSALKRAGIAASFDAESGRGVVVKIRNVGSAGRGDWIVLKGRLTAVLSDEEFSKVFKGEKCLII